MTEHPITPRPELLQRLYGLPQMRAIEAAFQAGADQELEACCEWLRHDLDAYELVGLRAVYLDHNLRAARRPKPPSLKEQALEDLDSLIADLANHGMGFTATNIRRALEALPE